MSQTRSTLFAALVRGARTSRSSTAGRAGREAAGTAVRADPGCERDRRERAGEGRAAAGRAAGAQEREQQGCPRASARQRVLRQVVDRGTDRERQRGRRGLRERPRAHEPDRASIASHANGGRRTAGAARAARRPNGSTTCTQADGAAHERACRGRRAARRGWASGRPRSTPRRALPAPARAGRAGVAHVRSTESTASAQASTASASQPRQPRAPALPRSRTWSQAVGRCERERQSRAARPLRRRRGGAPESATLSSLATAAARRTRGSGRAQGRPARRRPGAPSRVEARGVDRDPRRAGARAQARRRCRACS